MPVEARQAFESVENFPVTGGRVIPAVKALAGGPPYPFPRYLGRPYRLALEKHLRADYDVAWFNFLPMVAPLRRLPPPTFPVVVDQHESETELWSGFLEGPWLHRVMARAMLPKYRRMERQLLPHTNAVACVSTEEGALLRSTGLPPDRILHVPNGVDTDFFRAKPDAARGRGIIFCAGMGTLRNAQAAEWFAEQVFSKVREAVPDAELWLVGSNPRPEVEALAKYGGVHVTGTVADVRPYYDRCRLAVAPHQVGGFSKIKVAEAMSMGLPVAGTRSGLKGTESPARDTLSADDPRALAMIVAALLIDPTRCQEIGTEARVSAETFLDWNVILDSVDQSLRTLAGVAKRK